MKKYQYQTLTCIIIALFCVNKIYSEPVDFTWGTSPDNVKKGLAQDCAHTTFSLSDQSCYKNKIVSFMVAVDKNIKKDIVVLRTKPAPQTDYIFVKDRLYTVCRNWKVVDAETEAGIRSAITCKYGSSSVKKDGGFHIYSYNTDTTKVLFYRLSMPGNRYRCKVYYYTKKLFRMLLIQN